MEPYDVIELSSDQHFNLDRTLSCGQVFRWEFGDGWWYGVFRDRVIKIRQAGDSLHFEWVDEGLIRDYFQLDQDLGAIVRAINTDAVMKQALELSHGLRLIKQDPWECLIFQMCVTRTRPRQSKDRITRIAENLGNRLFYEGRPYYTFPDAGTVAEGGVRELKACHLGYLAENIYQAAVKVSGDEEWFERIRSLPYERARVELTSIKGLKTSVADWVLLFGFQRYEAFPADAHIRRVFTDLYLDEMHFNNIDSRKLDDVVRREAQKRFGQYAGYAFEYLFSAQKELTYSLPRS